MYTDADGEPETNDTVSRPASTTIPFRHKRFAALRKLCGEIQQNEKEVSTMATSKEITIQIEDRPGALGKLCRALAEWRVNIVAFYLFHSGGKSLVRMVVDDPTTTKTVLDAEHLRYTEAEVVLVRVPHRPGELAPTASRLGDANIDINYGYCGIEPGTNVPLLIFGVAEVDRAASTLEQAAPIATGS
jgi:hypothetical protein